MHLRRSIRRGYCHLPRARQIRTTQPPESLECCFCGFEATSLARIHEHLRLNHSPPYQRVLGTLPDGLEDSCDEGSIAERRRRRRHVGRFGWWSGRQRSTCFEKGTHANRPRHREGVKGFDPEGIGEIELGKRVRSAINKRRSQKAQQRIATKMQSERDGRAAHIRRDG